MSTPQVNVPAGFVDRHPLRGPWVSPEAPPDLYETVQVLLADGSTDHATWMGDYWWRDRRLRPIGWRRIENRGMTAGPP
ncbi:MAG TPA: hypothetical protein VHD61_15780 [Lacunisphaera sp.]|nr:hypothetical protein [Lacunisphaera sp.]